MTIQVTDEMVDVVEQWLRLPDPDSDRIRQMLRAALATEKHGQVGGTHYEDMPIMPFAIIDAFGLDFYGGNALKYLLRAGRKPGVDPGEDLKKARHYLDEMIARATTEATRPPQQGDAGDIAPRGPAT